MSRGDGGAAFPHEAGALISGRSGMTLRDYFAAKAMQGLLASDDHSSVAASRVAEWAYEQADHMLAARKEETR